MRILYSQKIEIGWKTLQKFHNGPESAIIHDFSLHKQSDNNLKV